MCKSVLYCIIFFAVLYLWYVRIYVHFMNNTLDTDDTETYLPRGPSEKSVQYKAPICRFHSEMTCECTLENVKTQDKYVQRNETAFTNFRSKIFNICHFKTSQFTIRIDLRRLWFPPHWTNSVRCFVVRSCVFEHFI